MAIKQTFARRASMTAFAWFVGFLIFFPILWMFLTSFKTEADAYAVPPKFLFFPWTTENYAEVQSRVDYFRHALNSILLAVGSNLFGLVLAIPAAWSMAFAPTKRTKDLLMWMLSTNMMPGAGVFIAIYFIFQKLHLIDSLWGVGFLLMMTNLPIVVWMLYTYFKEIPVDILEAARIDGATLRDEIIHILTPMAIPGIVSTMLLSVILSWNEAFWTLNLTNVGAAPLTNMIASFSSPEGDFWALLSAASVLAIAPILIVGWFSQKQLVRGLTFGAVK